MQIELSLAEFKALCAKQGIHVARVGRSSVCENNAEPCVYLHPPFPIELITPKSKKEELIDRWPSVVPFLKKETNIMAIKELRQVSGMTLVAAKREVDEALKD